MFLDHGAVVVRVEVVVGVVRLVVFGAEVAAPGSDSPSGSRASPPTTPTTSSRLRHHSSQNHFECSPTFHYRSKRQFKSYPKIVTESGSIYENLKKINFFASYDVMEGHHDSFIANSQSHGL